MDFAEAQKSLDSTTDIVHEVTIDGFTGALMTLKTFEDDCRNGAFVDYDGDGLQVSADGVLLAYNPDHNIMANVYPSMITNANEGAYEEIFPECAYILWFNK